MTKYHLKPNLDFEFDSILEVLKIASKSIPWLLATKRLKTVPLSSQTKLLQQISHGILTAFEINLSISGLEFLPSQPCVILPLHEGLLDPIALLQLPLPMRFVVRDELLSWQWFGEIIKATQPIEINPEEGFRSYRQLVRRAAAVFDRQEHLVIFPQGSVCGLEIDFQGGAFGIAKHFDKPILPVVLTGSHRVWDHPFHPQIRTKQHIALQILEPSHFPDRIDLQRHMKRLALQCPVQPRRYNPEQDGYWDDYRLAIDPDFSEVAWQMQQHRQKLNTSQPLP